MKDIEPQHIDYQELERATRIHIKGLKIQLQVAYASLIMAEKMRKKTAEEATKCELTKTATKE